MHFYRKRSAHHNFLFSKCAHKIFMISNKNAVESEPKACYHFFDVGKSHSQTLGQS